MSDIEEIMDLLNRIAPMLAGKPPQVQGGVLADLLATWLAGHIVYASEAETEQLREAVLEAHIEAVRALVPGNARDIHGE